MSLIFDNFWIIFSLLVYERICKLAFGSKQYVYNNKKSKEYKTNQIIEDEDEDNIEEEKIFFSILIEA